MPKDTIQDRKTVQFYIKTAKPTQIKLKTVHRYNVQNRKTVLFYGENRKTEQKNGWNRVTVKPKHPLAPGKILRTKFERMLRRIDQEPEMSQIKQLGQKLLPRAGQGENQKA